MKMASGYRCLMMTALVMVGGWSGGTRATDSTDYVVSVEISASTCDVHWSPSSPSISSVDPEELAKGGLHSMTQVDLQLTCTGVRGEQGKKPVLTVSGDTVPVTDNAQGAWLFHKAGGTGVSGMGFVLSNKNAVNWDTKDFVKAGDAIVLGNANETPTTQMKTYYVGVGCGTNPTCTSVAGENNTGELAATVTFTFEYQ
ncbi:hypothetical protein BL250_17455 [Erwinia sp. OLTSP20]|uniref:hypothetical protein n=1 Tax=unclassified Erwinia TaxID=2622719 RepID=UPI000C19B9B7|nr:MULTISPECIES: hypothetical protein [unclassified Erwinia]PIJ48204.1 hypothetical protein BV501_17980 [Erwinia sp. OAMSP11]PIJ66749.1 hypothetical protein BK416_17475 [Erwinia sp. OLSSP12]PIJ78196.1 hypothetical protein BLD47_17355 [Erwinia sp. OLCASP19]PIJ79013.1 hypothetical protein BLD46_17525 [Erwinia sp. OLMTSP26]PIJ80025.1 hypothetical protein BLD49_17250 [Erwinia sp. OLMDSP33]